MKQDVLLTIRSRQKFEGCPEESIELITGGVFYQRGGKHYLCYEESELTGMQGTKTTLKLDGERVMLLRSGSTSSQMVFVPGERHVGLYPTPAGDLTVSTYTQRVDNRIVPVGGRLCIDYALEVEHTVAGQNHFEITVSPTKRAEGNAHEQH